MSKLLGLIVALMLFAPASVLAQPAADGRQDRKDADYAKQQKSKPATGGQGQGQGKGQGQGQKAN